MLKSIRLQNFFGFQDCTIHLEKGANVLVGINGSGKSNFFKAIELFSRASNQEYFTEKVSLWGGPDKMTFTGKSEFKPTTQLQYEVDIRDMHPVSYHNLEYSLIFSPTFLENDYDLIEKLKDQEYGKGFNFERNGFSFRTKVDDESKIKPSTHNAPIIGEIKDIGEVDNLLRSILNTHVYSNIDLVKIRNGSPPSNFKYLLESGENLAALLQHILKNDIKTSDILIKKLQTVNEKFELFSIDSRTSGYKDIDFKEIGLNKLIPATHISDGTLKFLCLMAILYNPNRGSVICIDEPDLGLHPDMINTLHEAIEFAAETSQIIISTHSAHLLNYFELEQVRVFEKDENNATIVDQYSKKDFEGWQQKFQTGKMWREGSIGGKRW